MRKGIMYRATLYYDERCTLCKRSVLLLKRLDWRNALQPKPLSMAPENIRPQSHEERELILEDSAGIYRAYGVHRRLCARVFPFVLAAPIIWLGAITGLGPFIYGVIARHRIRVLGACEPWIYEEK